MESYKFLINNFKQLLRQETAKDGKYLQSCLIKIAKKLTFINTFLWF